MRDAECERIQLWKIPGGRSGFGVSRSGSLYLGGRITRYATTRAANEIEAAMMPTVVVPSNDATVPRAAEMNKESDIRRR